MRVTTTAPPKTKMRSGTQSPAMFRKPSTFAGSDIPDNVKPNPNRMPAISAGHAFTVHPPLNICVRATVIMPSAMNVRVATADRGERRPSPQTPCPLVHPPPMRVPMPTSNPLMATIHMGVRDGSGSGCPSAKCVTPPPNNKPIKKANATSDPAPPPLPKSHR